MRISDWSSDVCSSYRRVIHHDYVGVADFSNPSRKLRFHVLDMAGGKKSSLLVAHGRGSDPGHLGWVQRFSHDFGSNATSNGAYLTGAHYTGKHGRSMLLPGMAPPQCHAVAGAVGGHGAWDGGP